MELKKINISIAALKLESATRVTIIRSLQIVVSFVVQIFAWNEVPGLDQVKLTNFKDWQSKLNKNVNKSP